jgi:hypothetical protein
MPLILKTRNPPVRGVKYGHPVIIIIAIDSGKCRSPGAVWRKKRRI